MPQFARAMSRAGLLLLYSLSLCLPTFQLQASQGEGQGGWFEGFGDVFQFLPLMAGAYSLARQDYEGVAQLALGTGTALTITFASKYSFTALAQKDTRLASISQRPNHGSFDGFPSGHTASAFSAAGFIQKRYGWKMGLPTTLLATAVGISRITSQRHTVLQVLAGALLGYGLSYLSAKRLTNIVLHLDIDTEASYSPASPSATSPAGLGSDRAFLYRAGVVYRF